MIFIYSDWIHSLKYQKSTTLVAKIKGWENLGSGKNSIPFHRCLHTYNLFIFKNASLNNIFLYLVNNNLKDCVNMISLKISKTTNISFITSISFFASWAPALATPSLVPPYHLDTSEGIPWIRLYTSEEISLNHLDKSEESPGNHLDKLEEIPVNHLDKSEGSHLRNHLHLF